MHGGDFTNQWLWLFSCRLEVASSEGLSITVCLMAWFGIGSPQTAWPLCILMGLPMGHLTGALPPAQCCR